MANTIQAKKAVRQSIKHRAHNIVQRSALRTLLKKPVVLIENRQGIEVVEKSLKKACSWADRLAAKGAIHKNKAARHKQRLNAKLKQYKQSLNTPA